MVISASSSHKCETHSKIGSSRLCTHVHPVFKVQYYLDCTLKKKKYLFETMERVARSFPPDRRSQEADTVLPCWLARLKGWFSSADWDIKSYQAVTTLVE